MISVRLLKRINGHLPKGTIGQITDNDFKTWGVGPGENDVESPWKIMVYFGGDEMIILNTDLEKVDDANNNTKKQAQPCQQASLF